MQGIDLDIRSPTASISLENVTMGKIEPSGTLEMPNILTGQV
jgi:hypothetical protein